MLRVLGEAVAQTAWRMGFFLGRPSVTRLPRSWRRHAGGVEDAGDGVGDLV